MKLEPGVEGTSVSTSTDEFGAPASEGVQMVGIVDYPELQQGEVAFDNLGRPICKDGNRTGRTCGVQLMRARHGVWSVMHMDHGDSGGNAYDPDTNEVIGVNSMVVGPFSRVAPVDIAIEEGYGVPDGQVNERFKVVDSTAPRSDEYRTIGEDAAANAAAEGTPTLDELLKDSGLDIPDLPLPEVPLPEIPLPAASDVPAATPAAPADAASQILGQAQLPALF